MIRQVSLATARLLERIARRLRRELAPGAVPMHWERLAAPARLGGDFGEGRGTPIDRFYIDRFVQKHADLVRGAVLEFEDGDYTTRFGGDRVTKSDVMHVVRAEPPTTIVGDLEAPEGLPHEAFDCILCIQTLHYVYDTDVGIDSLYRMLRPGGSVLITVPGIAQLSLYDDERWGDYWRFTQRSLRRKLARRFPADAILVEAGGNVLSSVAFLACCGAEELTTAQLSARHDDYELVVCAVATKPV